jgi:hypothetical protein
VTTIVITDTSPRADIAQAIAVLRERALRYTVSDPRRLAIDEECDALVTSWLAAPDAEAR